MPSYPSGFLSTIICFGTLIVFCIYLRFRLAAENRRRDGAAELLGDAPDANEIDENLLDRTDKQLLSFRYVY